VQELARVTVHAASSFVHHFHPDTIEKVAKKTDFYEKSGLWLEEFFGGLSNAAEIAELKALITKIAEWGQELPPRWSR
jgi:hypothetical protein